MLSNCPLFAPETKALHSRSVKINTRLPLSLGVTNTNKAGLEPTYLDARAAAPRSGATLPRGQDHRSQKSQTLPKCRAGRLGICATGLFAGTSGRLSGRDR